MNNKVKFLRGTSNEYAAAEKDNDTIYFTTDDGKLYIGDKEISGTGNLTIDDTLSDTSANPVQNKVVKQAIDNKADKSLYGDTTINVGRKAGTNVGEYSTAECYNTTASGDGSHAEGGNTTASSDGSHAEGYFTIASGYYSHAEGQNTTASSSASHAEGQNTTASEESSHAEGDSTTASGRYSHAEGQNTTASGTCSHAGGIGTKALHDNEAAYGKYNESNDDTLFSVGDGTADNARHNAFEITKTGGKLHDKDIATTDLIPTSLPANGGNADYATVARDTQLFNGKPSGNYVQFLGIVQVDDMSTAPVNTYEYLNDSTYQVSYEVAVSPLVSVFMGLPNIWWHIKYYAYGYRNGYSCQTAFPVGFGGVPYIRYSQEGVWSDWKEISTTPIKKISLSSVGTNEKGGGALFSADFGTPITIACTSRRDTQCTSFYYGDGNHWLLLAKDAATLEPIPAGNYSFDVWYI